MAYNPTEDQINASASQVASLQQELLLTDDEAVELGKALIENPPLAQSIIVSKTLEARDKKNPLWIKLLAFTPIFMLSVRAVMSPFFRQKFSKYVLRR